MTLPRKNYVRDGQEGVFHCYTRCVRRAFLCGYDSLTGRDFSHRKAWVLDRLRFLASIFAIDVCAFSAMDTHLHNILRLRPDIAASWSDHDVALRWLSLYPKKKPIPLDLQISALTACPHRIALLRRRLSNLSWFMARLNEHIARAANKEDNVKGRFWESRFKCQALLDNAAILAAMVYVDLNPIRAGQAASPEDSDFTSIQQRIRDWHNQRMSQVSIPPDSSADSQSRSNHNRMQNAEPGVNVSAACLKSSPDHAFNITSSDWLCPIQSTPLRRGILLMSVTDYFDLVDRSGRILRSDKPGAIDPCLAPILLRIGANPQAWHDTISHFESRFPLAAGSLPSLRAFASQLGKRWFTGVTSARTAFSSSPL